MRVLNLYAGLGGNRKYWMRCNVTAVEYTQKIADVYQKLNTMDEVVVADAHQYLLDHYQEFDFIWSSPPCQSHSRMIRGGKNRKPRYPDLGLYEEILFLQHNFDGKWVVENVVPYYEPLIQPTAKIGRHLFWSNCEIGEMEDIPHYPDIMNATTVCASEKLKQWLGIRYEGNIYYEGNHCPAQVLRNCVHPDMGLHVFSEVIDER